MAVLAPRVLHLSVMKRSYFLLASSHVVIGAIGILVGVYVLSKHSVSSDGSLTPERFRKMHSEAKFVALGRLNFIMGPMKGRGPRWAYRYKFKIESVLKGEGRYRVISIDSARGWEENYPDISMGDRVVLFLEDYNSDSGHSNQNFDFWIRVDRDQIANLKKWSRNQGLRGSFEIQAEGSPYHLELKDIILPD